MSVTIIDGVTYVQLSDLASPVTSIAGKTGSSTVLVDASSRDSFRREDFWDIEREEDVDESENGSEKDIAECRVPSLISAATKTKSADTCDCEDEKRVDSLESKGTHLCECKESDIGSDNDNEDGVVGKHNTVSGTQTQQLVEESDTEIESKKETEDSTPMGPRSSDSDTLLSAHCITTTTMAASIGTVVVDKGTDDLMSAISLAEPTSASASSMDGCLLSTTSATTDVSDDTDEALKKSKKSRSKVKALLRKFKRGGSGEISTTPSVAADVSTLKLNATVIRGSKMRLIPDETMDKYNVKRNELWRKFVKKRGGHFRWKASELSVEETKKVCLFRNIVLSHNAMADLSQLALFAVGLESLLLDDNQITDDWLKHSVLFEMLSLNTLWLQNNLLLETDRVLPVLAMRCPNVEYLNLFGNPMCPEVDKCPLAYASYRQQVIAAMPRLLILDDAALSEEEFALQQSAALSRDAAMAEAMAQQMREQQLMRGAAVYGRPIGVFYTTPTGMDPFMTPRPAALDVSIAPTPGFADLSAEESVGLQQADDASADAKESDDAFWECPACTFHNNLTSVRCEMCATRFSVA